MINEFFEITRFNLTQLELELSTVSLDRMLEQTVYEFHPMLKEKSLTCRLDIEPEHITISCDPDKLQRVFDNLLRNAVLYSGEGGIIAVCAKAADGKVTVQVENSGATIPRVPKKSCACTRDASGPGARRGGRYLPWSCRVSSNDSFSLFRTSNSK